MIIPYTIPLQVTLSASGSATLQYQVPQNWKMRFKKLLKVSSTGNFNIVGIQDNGGQSYTNATQNTPINPTMYDPAVNNFPGAETFDPPLEQQGGGQIQILVIDTSAAQNTVKMLLVAEAEF